MSEVAERLGVDRKTVSRWLNPDGPGRGVALPHDRRMVGKIETVFLDWSEVVAWLEQVGIKTKAPALFKDAEKPEAAAVASSAAATPASLSPEAAAAETRPESTTTQDPDLLKRITDVHEMISRGDPAMVMLQRMLVDHQLLIARCERAIREGRVKDLSVGELDRFSSALEKTGKEARQADKAMLDLRERRGELVSRVACENLVEKLIEATIAACTVATQSLGLTLREKGCQIGEGESRLDDEAFDRVIVTVASDSLVVARKAMEVALRQTREAIAREAARNTSDGSGAVASLSNVNIFERGAA